MKISITVRSDSICEWGAMGYSELKKENGKWSYTWWGADEDELEDWTEELRSSTEMWERFGNFDWSEIMGFVSDPEYAHKVASRPPHGGRGLKLMPYLLSHPRNKVVLHTGDVD